MFSQATMSFQEDDDDDEDKTTSEIMLVTQAKTTPKRKFEYITIPGRDARPLTTIGPVAGGILFVLVLSLTSLVIWLRRREQRRYITQEFDKIPLSATTSEDTCIGYCPYKIDSESRQSGVYAQLDQFVANKRFPAVRSIPVNTSGRVRSLCLYDEPRTTGVAVASPKKAMASRPQSCIIGLGDYDEPEFRIPLGGEGSGGGRSTVMVNEGARELNLSSIGTGPSACPEEIYYSSLSGTETSNSTSTRPEDENVEPDFVYYSAINVKEQHNPMSILSDSTLPESTDDDYSIDTTNNTQRPFYFTLEDDRKKSVKKPTNETNNYGRHSRQDSFKYDYLQLTDFTPESDGAQLVKEEGGHCDSLSSVCLEPAESCNANGESQHQPLVTAPPCVGIDQGPKSAGNGVVSSNCGDDEDSVYNTLQRGKVQSIAPTRNSSEVYNVLVLD